MKRIKSLLTELVEKYKLRQFNKLVKDLPPCKTLNPAEIHQLRLEGKLDEYVLDENGNLKLVQNEVREEPEFLPNPLVANQPIINPKYKG
ncbi:hypothetical protein [Clostridioides difficile]|uniref:hypothetical protein n=1 Tax=Clostridioides difficile TaxID=1496 RepID=UPI001C16DAFE|nr:hypothetical protein [Clostridioides difficile]MDF3814727.1 hypothetical protein [Clostridioides difficile]HBF4283280.1 hypothetical protein [Clostridioides difficile]HBF5049266.1 hypothetical protein [Clostridioides difficile]HBF5112544.1 hypothetical protein [Clostridioides difficile]HBF5116120.1 hypothetical protein [Clostridioides difficile]